MKVQLNQTPVAGGGVHAFQFNPDGGQVAYLADQAAVGVNELYLVSINGGAAVKQNGSLPSGGDVAPDFQFSPTEARLIYRADRPERNSDRAR